MLLFASSFRCYSRLIFGARSSLRPAAAVKWVGIIIGGNAIFWIVLNVSVSAYWCFVFQKDMDVF